MGSKYSFGRVSAKSAIFLWPHPGPLCDIWTEASAPYQLSYSYKGTVAPWITKSKHFNTLYTTTVVGSTSAGAASNVKRAEGPTHFCWGLFWLTFFSSVRKKGGDEEAFFLLTHHDDVFSSFSLMWEEEWWRRMSGLDEKLASLSLFDQQQVK